MRTSKLARSATTMSGFPSLPRLPMIGTRNENNMYRMYTAYRLGTSDPSSENSKPGRTETEGKPSCRQWDYIFNALFAQIMRLKFILKTIHVLSVDFFPSFAHSLKQ